MNNNTKKSHILFCVALGMVTILFVYLIFLSTLGGIILFGFSGFVIGPVITSLLIAIGEMYEQFYRGEKVGD